MAYNAPASRTTNDLITAVIWNADIVANEIAINAGAIALASQAVGDIIIATSASQLGRVADVATGQVLVSGGVATAPAYSASPSITSLTLSTALTVPNGGTGVATRTAYGVIVGGTTATGATQTVTPGASGTVLTSGGASAVPTWAAASSGLSQSFRGLSLRTSPNADVAATTVTMLHADEIICSDGARRTPADNLSATITTSGINGLRASQSEAASTWYKVMYAYGGSGEGLYLEQAKDYFLDESQTAATGDAGVRAGSGQEKSAQTFDTDVTGYVEFVDVQIDKVASPTGLVWAELLATSAGAPSGSVLATSDKLNVSLVSASAQWVRFMFRAPIQLTAGTTYALALTGDFTISGTNYVGWRHSNADPYAAGSGYFYDGATWSIDTGFDRTFKVYVTENDNAVAPPTGYDTGYAHIGWVRNNGSSNFVEFSAVDRAVSTPYGSNSVGTVTATVYTLTDIYAFVPPVPSEIHFYAHNATTTTYTLFGSIPTGVGTNAAIAAANPGGHPAMAAPFATEAQGVYIKVGGGSSDIYLGEYQW